MRGGAFHAHDRVVAPLQIAVPPTANMASITDQVHVLPEISRLYAPSTRHLDHVSAFFQRDNIFIGAYAYAHTDQTTCRQHRHRQWAQQQTSNWLFRTDTGVFLPLVAAFRQICSLCRPSDEDPRGGPRHPRRPGP